MKILILGASGLVGRSLVKELSHNIKYDIYGTYNKNTPELTDKKSIKLNMKDLSQWEKILNNIRPDIVISALEGDFEEQLKLHNYIALFLSVYGGKIYFCSTAKVFDGDNSKVYYEKDIKIPESEYGKFKALCEDCLQHVLKEDACIIRLPQIIGKKSPRIEKLKYNIESHNTLNLYSNLYINSNTEEMAAKQIKYIIEEDLKGIFHLGTEDLICHKDLYVELAKNIGFNNFKIKEETLPLKKNYSAVLSTRKFLPERLKITHEHIIKSLC